MKKFREKFTGIVVLIVGLLIAPLICMAGQKLQIDDPVYRFSGVIEGIPLTHSFKIQNIGDAPLLIEKVMPP